MKKLLSLKNVLIAIAFTVFLLLVKDNMDKVWNIINAIFTILTPFFIGFLIAYILNFPYKFFHNKAFAKIGTKHKKLGALRKPLSIVCTYIIAAAVITVLIVIVVPQIVINISNLVESMPSYLKSASKNLQGIFDWINSVFQTNFTVDNTLQEATLQISKFFTGENLSKTADATVNVLGFLSNIVTNTAAGVYNFIMSIIISVYFLSAKDQLCSQVKRLAVAFIPIKYLPKVYEIVDITDTKCGRFLVGDVIDSALIGVLCFIVMTIFRLPYAPLIAVLVGITNIVPFFGPFIGGIPSAFILLLVDPMYMIWFVVIIFIIQQLDGNLFKPKIIGNQLGISSFWVLFSVIVGGALFGIPGFILGTPIYAVIYSLVGKRVRNNISAKGRIAQEALDFEVLNYAKIAAEQKRIREEKEQEHRKKLKKLIHLNREDEEEASGDTEQPTEQQPEEKPQAEEPADK